LVETDAAGTADFQLHVAAGFYAVKVRVIRRHVHVTHGANHAFLHFEKSRGAHQHGAERAFDVAGNSQGQFEAERDAIGVSEFDLVEVAARAENAEIGNDAAARAD